MRSAAANARAMLCSTTRTLIPSRLRRLSLVDLIDDADGESERGLVEEEKARPRQQRAGNRQLLLLAAGKAPRGLAVALAQDREILEYAFGGGASPRVTPTRDAADQQVLADRQRREHVATLRYQGNPLAHPLLRRERGNRVAEEGNVACFGVTTPAMACISVDLPAPFGPRR